MTRKPIMQGTKVIVMLGLEGSEWLQGTFISQSEDGSVIIIMDPNGRDIWIKNFLYMRHD